MSNHKKHKLEEDVLLIQGEALEVLKTIEDNSIHSIVTDPPYGLSNTKPDQVADVLKAWVTGDDTVVPVGKGFMGKDWDGFVPPPAVWKECLRVLKPGGHMVVFSGARTQDLMGLSIRLAGFEIRDTLGWIYGSGFPKSHDVSKAIDKAARAEREVVGSDSRIRNTSWLGTQDGAKSTWGIGEWSITAPATAEAKRWDGWGTALKPAIEPIILARKPIEGTVANNVLSHGVGGLNIDASRVEAGDLEELQKNWDRTQSEKRGVGATGLAKIDLSDRKPAGRFPANVLLDEHAAAEVDDQSGVSVSKPRTPSDTEGTGSGTKFSRGSETSAHSDSGGASRFFPVFKYQAKAPKKERPVIEREDGSKIQHPTVKPVALMKWLVTLITPPGGTVLDPFTGSGTTLEAAKEEGFESIGIEMGEEYILLVEERFRKIGEVNDRNQ